MADAKINLVTNVERRELRNAAVAAVAILDDIIANSNTVDVRQTIKRLAQHQRKIIRRLAQL